MDKILTDNAALALALAEQAGWHVFPCRPDKRPFTAHGHLDATRDPAMIRKYWESWSGALVGVNCERSGIFAVDLDYDPAKGINGVETWSGIANGRDQGLKWVRQNTPRGGYHLIFRLPAGVEIPNRANSLGRGIDTRSNGYICTGGAYKWVTSPLEADVTEAPGWLLDLFRKEESTRKIPGGNGRMSVDSYQSGQYWLDHYLQLAQPGNRNDKGFELACQLRDSGISRTEAEGIMLTYAAQVPDAGGDSYTDHEALESLESAYGKAPREPATLRVKVTAPPTQDSQKGQTEKTYVPDDSDIANRWIASHPETAWGMGEFRRYENGVWDIVPGENVKDELLQIIESAKLEKVRSTSRLLNSATELAHVKLYVAPKKWDSDIDVLVCKNGALHLPTRKLLPHSKDYYATSRVDYDYDPGAKSEIWEKVLQECVPDARDFIQEFAGYSLTTDTLYETAVWFYGVPGSGKSTVLTGFQAMLGARVGELGLADIERSRFALGEIPGKTLMVSTEQPETYLSATHILNAIISGERVITERKFKDPVTIIPRVKIAWALNELPRIGRGGVGLFRRVKVVKFPKIEHPDSTVKEQVKLAGAAILNWALDGLDRLRANKGFTIPESVAIATRIFRDSNDVPGLFVQENCLVGEIYRTQGSLLYKAYRDWCLENGHKPQSNTSVAEDWRNQGFEKYLSAGIAYWRGVGLIT